MSRKLLRATVACAAFALASPSLADPGQGAAANANVGVTVPTPQVSMPAGGSSSTAVDARVNSQGSVNADTRATERASPTSALGTDTATTVKTSGSQGLEKASTTGVAHANSNSALARGAVAATALPGLTTGLTVKNSTGVTLGTVSKVVTATDGSIRLIVVTSPTGKSIRVAPTTATISGGVVTTTKG